MMPAVLPLDEIPPHDVLRQLREEIGLTRIGLAAELGFKEDKGHRTVRDWEHGVRDGKEFRPTPTAWRCFRLLVVACRCVGMDVTAAASYLRAHLPEEAT